MTYLFHDNISGEEREVWLLPPEPLGHNRVCHIEPRDKVPTVKSTIKGGNYIGQKPATLETTHSMWNYTLCVKLHCV